MNKYGILLISSFASVSAWADCWSDAAQMYSVDPDLLKAIAWKESKGWTGAIGSPLKDGNVALGLMQINTVHLPVFRKYGVKKNDFFEPCTSIKMGAYVLADCIKAKGANWNAVGCYYGGAGSKAYRAMDGYIADVKVYYKAFRKQSLTTSMDE